MKEVLTESKDVLDDDAITDIIKTCNVIKNEKVAEAKRKVKGQAQKSKKKDKVAEAKAKKMAEELYGANDKFDEYGSNNLNEAYKYTQQRFKNNKDITIMKMSSLNASKSTPMHSNCESWQMM